MDYRNRAFLLDKHPEIAQAFDDVITYMNNIAKQTVTNPTGVIQAPPGISALSLSASQGIFDVSISDNSSSVARGINYFLEYSTSPNFVTPHVIDLGASRNWRGMLGNQTLYWRAYSSYPTSEKSNPVYFGGQANPTPVVGGGASSGPAPLPSNGSGTSTGANGGDGGFGKLPYRGITYPITFTKNS